MDNVVVYDVVDNDIKRNWNKLYEAGADYNLCYDWCSHWMKYFSNGADYHIVTAWENEELILLAPLLKRGKRLSLIGSGPDLYDQFSVLAKKYKALKTFCRYIVDAPYELDFRYLNASSALAKLLIKELCQNKIHFGSHIIDTKPRIDKLKIEQTKKIRDDIKRCKNRAQKMFGENLVYYEPARKLEQNINELEKLHIKRWKGGPFKNLANYSKFIRELYLGTDLVRLVYLKLEKSNRIAGIHMTYQGTNNIQFSNTPAYEKDLSNISPGKVLLYELLKKAAEKGEKQFDFGRGAESYKYWFATEDNVLFNIVTYKNKKAIMKYNMVLKRLANKLLVD